MAELNDPAAGPPKLTMAPGRSIETNSLAELVEWFLNNDERTARMRHAYVEELFQWKQNHDAQNGAATYPFENAEARFAVGVFQALEHNNSEPLLKLWLSDVLSAVQDAKQTKEEMTAAYKLDEDAGAMALEKAERLTNKAERSVYLTCCWLEALCTAEARVLGWVYQEIYGRPFTQSA